MKNILLFFSLRLQYCRSGFSQILELFQIFLVLLNRHIKNSIHKSSIENKLRLEISNDVIGFKMGCNWIIGGQFPFFKQSLQLAQKLFIGHFNISFDILNIGHHRPGFTIVQYLVMISVTVGKFLHSFPCTYFPQGVLLQNLDQFFIILLVVQSQNTGESSHCDLPFADQLFNETGNNILAVQPITIDILHVYFKIGIIINKFKKSLSSVNMIIIYLSNSKPIFNTRLPSQFAPGVFIWRNQYYISHIALYQRKISDYFWKHVHILNFVQIVEYNQRGGPSK